MSIFRGPAEPYGSPEEAYCVPSSRAGGDRDRA